MTGIRESNLIIMHTIMLIIMHEQIRHNHDPPLYFYYPFPLFVGVVKTNVTDNEDDDGDDDDDDEDDDDCTFWMMTMMVTMMMTV